MRDEEVIDALREIVETSPRWGFWKCFDRLRLPDREPVPLEAGKLVNQGWALDFMHDVLYDGRRFRTLT